MVNGQALKWFFLLLVMQGVSFPYSANSTGKLQTWPICCQGVRTTGCCPPSSNWHPTTYLELLEPHVMSCHNVKAFWPIRRPLYNSSGFPTRTGSIAVLGGCRGLQGGSQGPPRGRGTFTPCSRGDSSLSYGFLGSAPAVQHHVASTQGPL